MTPCGDEREVGTTVAALAGELFRIFPDDDHEFLRFRGWIDGKLATLNAGPNAEIIESVTALTRDSRIADRDRPRLPFAFEASVVLRAIGDSMINAGILDGDTLYAVASDAVKAIGQVVTCKFGEGVYVKRLVTDHARSGFSPSLSAGSAASADRTGPKVERPLPMLALLLALLLTSDPHAPARARMVDEVMHDVRETARETGRAALDARVINAMRTTARHLFVPAELQRDAYRNRPLPIGHGQTISQPYIVALMTDLLRTKPGDVVLEVGTGSGYQAAILAPLVKQVYTVEIVEPLAKQASARLQSLGYKNVVTRHADGYNGWKEAGPFDAIIVTAAATHIPPPLIQQLKPGGRMIIPVGGPFATQSLMLVEKTSAGKVRTRNVLPVVFVPLTRPK